MKHLDELCCDACREKVAAIEARDQVLGENIPAAFVGQAAKDRRELLLIVEQLLGTVAKQRERYNELETIALRSLIARADALKLKLAALPPANAP